ncbi:type VII secretion protein EccE [Streptomyces sp. NPDC000410]|uniref:type VII secretion protein EccE n=1 Tax=Streptomyces sp. NPDC000410 TaxID=3154254 RepID=UPI00332A9C2B
MAEHTSGQLRDQGRTQGPSRGRSKPPLGVGLGHLVAWEAVVALVAVGLLGPLGLRPVALALAVPLFAATAVRVQQRWLYDWLLTRMRFRSRRRVRGGAAANRLAPLRTVLPELSVARAEGRSRVRLGIVHDGAAWVALVAIEPSDWNASASASTAGSAFAPAPGDGSGPAVLPAAVLGSLLQVDDIAYDSVQILIQNVTAPAGDEAASPLAAAAYQELNADSTPLRQNVWVALRLDEAACPEAVAARGGGEPGIRRALRRGAVRAVALLEDAGLRARILDEDEATEALAAAAGLRHADDSDEGRPVAAETWTSWHALGTGHVTCWIRDFKAATAGLTGLQDLLATFPARATGLSVTFVPGGGCTVLVRTSGAAPQADSALPPAAAQLGLRLERLDGDQAAGLLATLPLGRRAGGRVREGIAPVPAELALSTAGFVLGTRQDGTPATVPLLRRDPVRLGVFVPREQALLLVFRLLAAGVLVHVRTPQPQAWAALMRAADTDPRHLVINLPGGTTPPPGGPMSPVAVVDEFTGTTGAPRADLGAWQLGVSIHPKPPAGRTDVLRRYDALLVPRLTLPLTREACAAYELHDGALRLLPMLPRHTTAFIVPGSADVLNIAPTPVEDGLLATLGYGHA